MKKILIPLMLMLCAITATQAQLATRITNSIGAGKLTKGDTLKNILLDMLALNTIAPTYTAPTTTISGTVAAGNIEIGSAVNQTLSSTFTQNDAGAVSTTTYLKNGVALGSNTDNIASLTAAVSYTVTKAYAQGACKNNNLGVQDCTGRITAGSITSAALTLTPLPKVYYGFTATNNPNDATVLALTNELRSSTGSFSATYTTQSSTYLVFAVPASYADLTNIAVNGFPAISSFTKTTRAVVNAQGYSQSYDFWISNNIFTTSGSFTAN